MKRKRSGCAPATASQMGCGSHCLAQEPKAMRVIASRGMGAQSASAVTVAGETMRSSAASAIRNAAWRGTCPVLVPSRSSANRNWPSQPSPLPMENTSMLVCCAMYVATFAGTTSISTAMQPAFSSAMVAS